MKKVILFMSLLLLVCGCDTKQISIKGNILLSGTKKQDGFYTIYKLNSYTTVYSTFSSTVFKDENDIEIGLKKALEDKKLTIDDIISNMDNYDASNDGGSVYYKSKDGKVYFAKCNSLPANGNNKNIYITDDENILNYCTNK